MQTRRPRPPTEWHSVFKRASRCFQEIYNDPLLVPLLSCLATEPWLCSTFKCQMKYICNPKATWIRFQTEGVPLGQNLNNLYWEKCFAEDKRKLFNAPL